MPEHRDALSKLNDQVPLKEKLVHAHRLVQEYFPFIARIAVTVYDPETRVLKSYLNSAARGDPLEHYQALIDDAPSLKAILDKGQPRVVNNLLTYENSTHEHARRIGRHGYLASYTLPMFHNGLFLGFIFFNSDKADVFDEAVLRELDLFGHLIALMMIGELITINVLSAAIKTTTRITHARDPETGTHLDRMSRYCRLIAQALADQYDLDDDYIEHVFMFAPLHDIGKIAIPDSILLKPGELNADEAAIMKTHPSKGRQMIDDIIRNFQLDGIDHVSILRNIAEYHHEAVNGTGYPEGRRGREVPLEARIVAVADVFDALTSRRPYKEAWSNDQAFATLAKLAGERLDNDCVTALMAHREEIEAIQKRFAEDPYG